MGLFSKLKCSKCGKESRLDIREFLDGQIKKPICENCLAKMHVTGFLKYCDYLGIEEVSYPMLESYSEHYDAIVNNPKYHYSFTTEEKNELSIEYMESITHDIGVSINNNWIAIPGFQDLLIETKDIFAVTIDSVSKFSDTFTEAIMISFFSNNPMIPYFAVLSAGKVKFFSISLKAKKYRDAVISILEDGCENLKYEIVSSGKLRKMVKMDEDYSSQIDKKELLDLLSSVSGGYGKFNPKRIAGQIPKDYAWIRKLDMDMGNTFIIS